jgi:c-di-GMP-binding flagellar brake protein YcgR
MTWYLLQAQVRYFKEDDPLAATILAIGLGAVLVLVLVINLLKRGLGGKMGSGTASPRLFSWFALNRAVRPYGLSHSQKKILEYVFRNNGVTDPVFALNSPKVLDKYFKRAYVLIERTVNDETEAQQRLAQLFAVRNIIEIVQNTSSASSSQQIGASQAAVLTVNQESYQTKVISTRGDSFFVDCPKNTIGTLLRLPKGTKVTVAFFKNNKAYSFDSKVLGFSETTFGPALQLTKGAPPKAMTQRRFRRKQAVLSCGFNLVRVEAAKDRKSGTRMVVDPRHFTGKLVDISIGGCAILSGAAVPVGSRMKIEFEYSRSVVPVAVLGQVLRINRGSVTSTILHVKFLKVPRKAMNAINTIVFEYSEE